ncbi:uncharacterized protein B0I36DRAFT_400345 [Microdochium trichocladiopsis]|uniref:Uncharacterized protein n=1 Tax=Microdochium trichocladiopsis TaxID=1682393 RepID=A0A9P8XQT8_9PEZI|nr:uncharacterized protein B0I36DRAFT_400345 [Microdochium trichocladiopsis]KAH7012263.1 hypothetical protein B0I36DRAFT_400345 [Microdochium trichocladiopsis]
MTSKVSQRLLLEDWWKVICKNDAHNPDYASLTTLDFYKDTFASLPDLDEYLKTVNRLALQEPVARFSPKCSLHLPDPREPPRVLRAGSSLPGRLAATKFFGYAHLRKVYNLLCEYHAAAHGTYQNNPEATSLMVLACLELWIACNKSALKICPLLSKYHDASVQPSLIRALLQSLILLHKSQLERLKRIESYLDLCSGDLNAARPSVFDSFGKTNAFYVGYYESSLEQQQLYAYIERQANGTRQQKMIELANLQRQHASLKAQADVMVCTYRDVIDTYGHRTRKHTSRKCKKCRKVREYQALEIGVHEWPLPKRITEAQNVVFELRPPKWFPAWRDATAFLLFDVLSLSSSFISKVQKIHELFDYKALMPYRSASRSQKITVVSQAKSFLKSHYRTIKIGSITSDSQVLVDHALHYEYFDPSARVLAGPALLTDKIPRRSTPPQLTSTSYPLFVFHAQCITQAGPPDADNVLRESHAILADPAFSQELMDGVITATSRAAESWQSAEALRAFILIVTRTLQLTTDLITIRQCLEYLVSARKSSKRTAERRRSQSGHRSLGDVRNEPQAHIQTCTLDITVVMLTGLHAGIDDELSLPVVELEQSREAAPADGSEKVEEPDAVLGELAEVFVDHLKRALEDVLHDVGKLVLHQFLRRVRHAKWRESGK